MGVAVGSGVGVGVAVGSGVGEFVAAAVGVGIGVDCVLFGDELSVEPSAAVKITVAIQQPINHLRLEFKFSFFDVLIPKNITPIMEMIAKNPTLISSFLLFKQQINLCIRTVFVFHGCTVMSDIIILCL